MRKIKIFDNLSFSFHGRPHLHSRRYAMTTNAYRHFDGSLDVYCPAEYGAVYTQRPTKALVGCDICLHQLGWLMLQLHYPQKDVMKVLVQPTVSNRSGCMSPSSRMSVLQHMTLS
jgi:hypothetical protein